MGCGGRLYLKPDFVTRLWQPLFDGNMGGRLWQMRSLAVLDQLCTMSTGAPLNEMDREVIILAAEQLTRTAELREELFPVFWERTGLRADSYGSTAIKLSQAGVLFLAENNHEGRKWIMPSRLPSAPPEDHKKLWTSSKGTKSTECLTLVRPLGATTPPGLFERILSACQCFGVCHRVWRGGAHFITSNLSDVKHLLVEVGEREKVEDVEEDDGLRREEDDGFVGAAGSFGGGSSGASFKQKDVGFKQLNANGEVVPKGVELSISVLGDAAKQTGLWASLMFVRDRAQVAIDDVPGVLKLKTVLICPGCLAKNLHEPSLWPVEDVSSRTQRCEKCSSSLTLQNVDLETKRGNEGNSLIIQTAATTPELKYCADKLRLGRPLEAAPNFSLWNLLGLKEAEEEERLKVAGEAAIVEEVAAHAALLKGTKLEVDEYGLTDVDWLRYILNPSFDVNVKLPAVVGGKASPSLNAEQARANEFDVGRKDASLDKMLKHPLIVQAGLGRSHLLALRLYTSTVSRRINMALHDLCSAARPHPYPATVIMLIDALNRLRGAQGEACKAAVVKAEALTEAARKAREAPQGEEDDASKAEAARKAAEANAEVEALKNSIFWR